jgi:hypothetical protein
MNVCFKCETKEASITIHSRIYKMAISLCEACYNENEKVPTINEIPTISDYFQN